MARIKVKSIKGLREDAEKILALKEKYDMTDRKDTNLLKAVMVGLVNANYVKYVIKKQVRKNK